MKKNKKILIVLGILLIILILFIVITKKPTSKIIEEYLLTKDFVKEENSTLYTKTISDISLDKFEENISNKIDSTYEKLSFNLDNYQLTKVEKKYEDEIFTTFTPTYYYSTDKLNYIYRITLNSTNVILEGSYDYNTDDFICETTYAHDIDIDKSEAAFCEKIKYDVKDFYFEALNLITNAKLLEYMKEN